MLSLSQTVAERTRLFNQGRFIDLVNYFNYPFVLQIEDRLETLQTPLDAIAELRRMHADILSRDSRYFTSRVVAIELPKQNRFRAWVELTLWDGPQTKLATSTAIQYYQKRRGWYCMEMQHVVESNLSQQMRQALAI